MAAAAALGAVGTPGAAPVALVHAPDLASEETENIAVEAEVAVEVGKLEAVGEAEVFAVGPELVVRLVRRLRLRH